MKVLKFTKEESDNVTHFLRCFNALRTKAHECIIKSLLAREEQYINHYGKGWRRFIFDKKLFDDVFDFKRILWDTDIRTGNLRVYNGLWISSYKNVTPLSTSEIDILMYFTNAQKLNNLKTSTTLYNKYAYCPFELNEEDVLKLENLYEDFIDLKKNLSTISTIEIEEPRYSTKKGFILYER